MPDRGRGVLERYAGRFCGYLAGVKRLLLVALLAACSGGSKTSTTPTGGGGTTAPEKVLVNVDAEGVGLGGFDPVAYRTFDKAVAGLPEHVASHGGATYRFSSSDNAAAFKGAEHAPGYGGFCAYAASMGRLSPADPLVFEIYEGQLLVFTNADFRDQFDADRAGNKAKADANWPKLVADNAK